MPTCPAHPAYHYLALLHTFPTLPPHHGTPSLPHLFLPQRRHLQCHCIGRRLGPYPARYASILGRAWDAQILHYSAPSQATCITTTTCSYGNLSLNPSMMPLQPHATFCGWFDIFPTHTHAPHTPHALLCRHTVSWWLGHGCPFMGFY